jgi:GNAT superfamily N-acetyltransferase
MRRVNDYSEIANSINQVKLFKEGYFTNYFVDPEKLTLWIRQKKLFSFRLEKTIFYLMDSGNFYRLYYFTPSPVTLETDIRHLLNESIAKKLVADIVSKQVEFDIKSSFEKNGFAVHNYLLRMSRMNHQPDLKLPSTDNLHKCQPSKIDDLVKLFESYFEPLSEQIPSRSDLANWVNSGSILTYEIEGLIKGFIIYDLLGLSSYLRYWFVHPDYRGQKVGSRLFNYFLYKSKDTKKQFFWVLNDNYDAINKYRHYGFVEEKMYNFVMVK